jgi:hypothetical protein
VRHLPIIPTYDPAIPRVQRHTKRSCREAILQADTVGRFGRLSFLPFGLDTQFVEYSGAGLTFEAKVRERLSIVPLLDHRTPDWPRRCSGVVASLGLGRRVSSGSLGSDRPLSNARRSGCRMIT